MPLAGLSDDSIVDGPGLRLVVFVQGCPRRCRNCHNPKTHPLTGGQDVSIAEIVARYQKNPLLDGITFSGGEPFLYAWPLALLAQEIHALGGNVITYTGYTFETILRRLNQNSPKGWVELLDQSEILIDGPYMAKLRDPSLPYCGSSNQRVLDQTYRQKLAKQLN